MSENKVVSFTSELVKISGLFLFKEGMATIFSEKGEAIPVTILKYEPQFVTQIKTFAEDGYQALQLGILSKKEKNVVAPEKGHFAKSGIASGFKFVREIRLAELSGIKLGDVVSIESLAKGDVVKLTSKSKGKGFAGSVKRWGFAGGPASHGSKFHRRPGSSGNRTWPGRVMPGKKFPGHLGADVVTVKSVEIVDVLPAEGVVIVKGPVPGSRKTLVKLLKG